MRRRDSEPRCHSNGHMMFACSLSLARRHFIFILTDNVLDSPWCLKELEAAVQYNIPVIIVKKASSRPSARSARASILQHHILTRTLVFANFAGGLPMDRPQDWTAFAHFSILRGDKQAPGRVQGLLPGTPVCSSLTRRENSPLNRPRHVYTQANARFLL